MKKIINTSLIAILLSSTAITAAVAGCSTYRLNLTINNNTPYSIPCTISSYKTPTFTKQLSANTDDYSFDNIELHETNSDYVIIGDGHDDGYASRACDPETSYENDSIQNIPCVGGLMWIGEPDFDNQSTGTNSFNFNKTDVTSYGNYSINLKGLVFHSSCYVSMIATISG